MQFISDLTERTSVLSAGPHFLEVIHIAKSAGEACIEQQDKFRPLSLPVLTSSGV